MKHERVATLIKYYPIGELVSIDRLYGGFINTSYLIVSRHKNQHKRFVVRFYAPDRKLEDVLFEHALLEELWRRGFRKSPRPLPTISGKTYLSFKCDQGKDGTGQVLVAVFNYIQGENRYTWERPFCSIGELREAADLLAHYHHTIFQWQAPCSCRRPNIVEIISKMRALWEDYFYRAGKKGVDSLAQKYADELMETLQHAQRLATSGCLDGFPELAVHGDYHPGNLRFSGSRISGVLDFDWSRIDKRCFDVGLAVAYFCTSWDSARDGCLDCSRALLFLEAYQEAGRSSATVGPLSREEVEVLPEMIRFANLFVLDWLLHEHDSFSADCRKRVRYLRHYVHALQWLQRQMKELKSSLDSISTMS